MQSSRKLSAVLVLAFLILAPFLLCGVRALASPVALAPGGELGALTQPRSPTQAEQGSGNSAREAITVWDTGQPSAEPLTASALKSKTGWSRISAPEKHDSFQGDAVISNGRITAVLRQRSPAVEIYSASSLKVGLEDSAHPTAPATPRLRLQLLKSGDDTGDRLEKLSLV